MSFRNQQFTHIVRSWTPLTVAETTGPVGTVNLNFHHICPDQEGHHRMTGFVKAVHDFKFLLEVRVHEVSVPGLWLPVGQF